MLTPGSHLWQYLNPEQRALALDGELLTEERKKRPLDALSDYSYLVFPYAKLFEGFLKQLFLDLGVIARRDYQSDHFRIGKVLSPNMARRLGRRSAYAEIAHRFGIAYADEAWHAWKQGRNVIFHYFPHNYKRLRQTEAQVLIQQLVETMEDLVKVTHVRRVEEDKQRTGPQKYGSRGQKTSPSPSAAYYNVHTGGGDAESVGAC